ncbi:MAG: GTP cyclohydrolase FolE2 [Thermodesulfobacteriota bacterium]|nr:GTP cyclohydrolase FolE2 [Thermodesulfobacteriota bacterium]
MKDIQRQRPENPMYIQKVGVKGISYPIVVSDRVNARQHTVASINLYVDLPIDSRGTHMSRFIEILNEYRKDIHIKMFEQILEHIRTTLEATNAYMEITFPYFIKKTAPVSGLAGLMEYTCSLIGSVGEKRDFRVEVNVPIQTLCPCSKEISAFGAHNQRSRVSLVVQYEKFFWIEDLISIIESCGSSPVYPVLKRPDEKYVTEYAYEHPMFVEDVVRQIASLLNQKFAFPWYRVEAENYESIHNHNAYACIEGGKDL